VQLFNLASRRHLDVKVEIYGGFACILRKDREPGKKERFLLSEVLKYTTGKNPQQKYSNKKGHSTERGESTTQSTTQDVISDFL